MALAKVDLHDCNFNCSSKVCFIHNDILNDYFKTIAEQDSTKSIKIIKTVELSDVIKKFRAKVFNSPDTTNKQDNDVINLTTTQSGATECKKYPINISDEDKSKKVYKPVKIIEIAMSKKNRKRINTENSSIIAKKPTVANTNNSEQKNNVINIKPAKPITNKVKVNVDIGKARQIPAGSPESQSIVERKPNTLYIHLLFPPEEQADIAVKEIKSLETGITDFYIIKKSSAPTKKE